jgi:hypothetical protein
MKCQTVIIFVLFSVTSLSANILISEQTDILGDASPGFCDITAARIWQVDSSHYQLEIEVASDIPGITDTEEWIRFSWFADCDSNPNTGQPHGSIGSEFNIIALLSQNPDNNHARIDVTGSIEAAGGEITKFVTGRTITVLVPFNKIANASQFYWKCQISTGSQGFKDQTSDISFASPSDVVFDKSFPERVVVERNIAFRKGYTSKIPEIYLQNNTGKPLRVEPEDTIEFYPYSDFVDVADSCIYARESEFRPVYIAAKVNGRLSDNLLVVQSGSTWTDPPILHLDLAPGGQIAGSLRAKAEDAYGNSIDLSSMELDWQIINGAEKINLQAGSSPENVDVIAVDTGDTGLAAIRPVIEGFSANSVARIRISAAHYDLPEFQMYEGDLAAFFLPGSLCFSPAGSNIDQMITQYQITQATDAAIQLQYVLTGTRAQNADRQYYAAILSDETGDFCGFNGNPIALGFRQDEQYPRSCIQVQMTGEPHWFTYFHESGHNATVSNDRISTCLHSGASPLARPGVFIEANATISAMYSMWRLVQEPDLAGLSPTNAASLNSAESYSGFLQRRSVYMDALIDYEQAPELLNVDKDIIDGMFIFLCEEYGWDKLPRFFSIFLPEEEIFNFDPHQDQTSFIAACFSAAFESDLLEIMRDKWAFPIDEDFYYGILPQLQKLAALRDQPPLADISNDGNVDMIDFSLFSASWMSITGQPAYNPKCNFNAQDASENTIDIKDMEILAAEWLL